MLKNKMLTIEIPPGMPILRPWTVLSVPLEDVLYALGKELRSSGETKLVWRSDLYHSLDEELQVTLETVPKNEKGDE